MRCPHCANSREPGWLCAVHAGRQWEHDDFQAEATRCVCNPTGAIFGTVIAEELNAPAAVEISNDDLCRALTEEELAEVRAIRALRDRLRKPLH